MELRGLGVRSVSAETVESLGGFRRSVVAFRCGSLGDMSECPFNVLFSSGPGVGTFGGGGNGGGNFPRRKPVWVLSVPAPPRPVKRSAILISTRSVELELDLTSERYSRSSPERANELRGEGDDKRGRENRLRKRDTADPGGASSSCVTGSAGGNARLNQGDKEATRTGDGAGVEVGWGGVSGGVTVTGVIFTLSTLGRLTNV